MSGMKKIISLIIVVSVLLTVAKNNVIAAGNSAENMYEAGMEYFEKEDYGHAFSYFQISGEVKGYVPAQNMLGVCYRDGLGIEADIVEAEKYFRLSADQGYAHAQENLAALLNYGEYFSPMSDNLRQEVAQPEQKTPAIISLSLDENNKPVLTWNELDGVDYYSIYRSEDGKSYTNLNINTKATTYTVKSCKEGRTYFFKVKAFFADGSFSEFSKEESISIPGISVQDPIPIRSLSSTQITTVANNKKSESIYLCGIDYLYKKQDYTKALECLEEAVEEGHSGAMAALGEIYYYGYGVTKNYEKARSLYQQSAELGDPQGMQNLADYYFFGDAGAPDYERAFTLYTEAAGYKGAPWLTEGYPWSYFHLGEMYLKGYGTERNYKIAAELFEKAAKQGISYAMLNLADMYYFGNGVAQDLNKAKEWYQKAADLGIERAEQMVGRLEQIEAYLAPHVHKWKEATCTEPKTCEECGETEGKPLGHDWKKETSGASRACARCGVKEEKAFEIAANNLTVGDYITFGTYEQDNDSANGKEPIEWLVLDVQGDRAFLISRYGLDYQKYYQEYANITWEYSSLRKWLNREFLEDAFSPEEKNNILSTPVPADDNPDYDTDPGNETTDKVFILSVKEAYEYFSSDEERACEATIFAEMARTRRNSAGTKNLITRDCSWWLRTPGISQNRVAGVDPSGKIDSSGNRMIDIFRYLGVRPALWINLD